MWNLTNRDSAPTVLPRAAVNRLVEARARRRLHQQCKTPELVDELLPQPRYVRGWFFKCLRVPPSLRRLAELWRASLLGLP